MGQERDSDIDFGTGMDSWLIVSSFPCAGSWLMQSGQRGQDYTTLQT